MIFNKAKYVLAGSLTAMSALLAPARSASNAADPNWTIHSSIYNQPRRIIDTPSKLYLFAHPTTYNTSAYNRYYNGIGGALFVLDKASPDAGFRNMAADVPFSGFDMKIVEVNPSTGVMAIAYTDGGIDLVSPQGKVTHIADLKSSHNYRMASILALTFDRTSGKLFVSTGGGFLIIDPATGQITDMADWRDEVKDIVRVGNQYLAIINNRIHAAMATDDIRHRSAFKELPSATPHAPLRLLSFSDNRAGYVSANGTVLQLSKVSDFVWGVKVLANTPGIHEPSQSIVNNSVEHTLFTIPGGYALNAQNKIYLFKCEGENTEPSYTEINVPGVTSQYAGTCDGTSFWFWQSDIKLINSLYDGSKWNMTATIDRPAAPHTAKDVHFLYSPTHGFLAVNRYANMRSNAVESIMPLSIASYRDGKWTDLSPRKELPYFIEEDPSLVSRYKGDKTYPIAEANGVVIDPLHPDVLVAASVWDGVAGVYLDDPRRKSHLHVNSQSGYISLYGALPVFPQSTWGSYTGLQIIGADADNNIWASRSNLRNTDGSSDSLSQLWVLTPEARNEAFESGNTDIGGGWKHMETEGYAYTEFFLSGAVLNHPKNKNKFLLNGQMNNGKGRPLRVYDTNGTIDTSADDTFVDINFVRRDDGSQGTFGNIYGYFEDPSTGDIYLFTSVDLYILDLNDPVVSNTIPARSFSLDTEEGNKFVPVTPAIAYSFCEDEYGRLWIGTTNNGVFGISPDRKKMVAHFTAENSALPANAVHGLGWNPETKTLFISTPIAIAEVAIESPAPDGGAQSSSAPFAFPASVTPEYGGTVAIHNVPSGVSLRVRNSQGTTVALISNAENGIAYWNLLDSEGRRVPTGVYKISDASGSPSFEAISLPVMR